MRGKNPVSPTCFRSVLLEAVSRHNILPLTSSCNLRCLFCSHRQLPPETKVYYFPPLPETELRELIPFLDKRNRITIGESATRLCEGEPFTHRAILPLLFSLRKQFPRTPLQITTNGTRLTLDTIRSLKKLDGRAPGGEPLLELVVSLNCTSASARAAVLGDKEPQRVISGLEYCRKLGVTFHGSVVAVPHLAGWDDLEQTLLLLDTQGARTIRLFLPGYTRLTPAAYRGDVSLWDDIAAFRQCLTGRLQCPLLLEPPLKKDLLARVEGIVPGTPAQRAGLRAGDIITAVNGEGVRSGVAAFNRIKQAAHPLLTVTRPPAPPDPLKPLPTPGEFQLCLDKGKGMSSGLVIAADLSEELMINIATEINRRHARSPLLLTSGMAAPLWETARCSGHIPPYTNIRIVANQFLGGTICCAGLLTVSDLRTHLRDLLRTMTPDLVFIPATPFDRGGRDLCGENFQGLLQEFSRLGPVVLSSWV